MSTLFFILAGVMAVGCLTTTYMAGWYAGRNKIGDYLDRNDAWGWFRLLALLGLCFVVIARSFQ